MFKFIISLMVPVLAAISLFLLVTSVMILSIGLALMQYPYIAALIGIMIAIIVIIVSTIKIISTNHKEKKEYKRFIKTTDGLIDENTIIGKYNYITQKIEPYDYKNHTWTK